MVVGYSDVSAILKDFGTLVKKSKDVEMNNKMLDLQRLVYDLIMEKGNLELQVKNLKMSLAKLNEDNLHRKELTRYKQFWVANESVKNQLKNRNGGIIDDNILQFVYCPKCYGNSSKLVSVENVRWSGNLELICPVCQYHRIIK